MVDAEGKVTYADGTPTPEFDKHAQNLLENILDKSHPLWQAGAAVIQATYAYVLSPLSDEIRLVPSNHSCFLFKEHTDREQDDPRTAIDETGRNPALRPHPRQCL